MKHTGKKAITLLNRHDRLAAEIQKTRDALNRACTDYGREQGMWGYTPNHLRNEMKHNTETQANKKGAL